MNRKISLSLLTILVLVAITIAILVNNNPRDQSGTQLPNVIFILADDMGYGDLQVIE